MTNWNLSNCFGVLADVSHEVDDFIVLNISSYITKDLGLESTFKLVYF